MQAWALCSCHPMASGSGRFTSVLILERPSGSHSLYSSNWFGIAGAEWVASGSSAKT
jgi:hypothetical protein